MIEQRIRIDKSANDRVIVAAVQIVEAGFGIIVITTVTVGVDLADGVSQSSGDAGYHAPGIILIGYYFLPLFVKDTDDVELQIADVIVRCAVVQESQQIPCIVIQEIQSVIAADLGQDGGAVQVIIRLNSLNKNSSDNLGLPLLANGYLRQPPFLYL